MKGETTETAERRFEFGENWARFLSVLDDERIDAAVQSLRDNLQAPTLEGMRFLDIGSGSGLFSLAARRLGAEVVSFDYDAQSVECTRELRRRFFPGDSSWRIEQASALDGNFLEGLGRFDVVYSWGVLHHTGAMWLGIENAIARVAGEGKLYIALYNDQGWKSHLWWFIKLIYNRLPSFLRPAYVFVASALTRIAVVIKYLMRLQPKKAFAPLLRDARRRGMSAKFDRVDWIGGFPYEFVEFDTLSKYFLARGFTLLRANRNSSHGCHEMVLQRGKCVE